MAVVANDNHPPTISPAAIARRVLEATSQGKIPRARAGIAEMTELHSIGSDADYLLVASMRRDLANWHGFAARDVKNGHDTILTLYQAE